MELYKKYLKENKEIDKLNDKYEYIAEEMGLILFMCNKFLPLLDPKEKSKAVKFIKEMDKGFDKSLISLRNYLKFIDKNIKE